MSFETSAAMAAYIQSHLDEDLALLVQQPHTGETGAALAMETPLPPTTSDGVLPLAAAPPARGRASADHFMVLQVMSVCDVSLPLEARLRALAGAAGGAPPAAGPSRSDSARGLGSDDEEAAEAVGIADAVLQASDVAHEARRRRGGRSGGGGGRRRCLTFVLTDGRTQVRAVETRPPPGVDGSTQWRPLLPEGVALGAKLKVLLSATTDTAEPAWRPQHSHGVLRLHALNTVHMGGAVAALAVFWQQWAVAQLEKLSGRPAKPSVGPPAEAAAPPARPAAPNAGPTTDTDRSCLADAASAERHTPPCRRLAEWTGRAGPREPFVTRAVIVEVTSDLLINEFAGAAGQADSSCVYSLMVALGEPDGAERDSGAADVFMLHVDLGHRWLRELVGMPASRFRAFSQSQLPEEQEQLQRIIERVGSVLEGLGEAFFTLRQRPVDGVVEVVSAEPVVGGGRLQSQSRQDP